LTPRSCPPPQLISLSFLRAGRCALFFFPVRSAASFLPWKVTFPGSFSVFFLNALSRRPKAPKRAGFVRFFVGSRTYVSGDDSRLLLLFAVMRVFTFFLIGPLFFGREPFSHVGPLSPFLRRGEPVGSQVTFSRRTYPSTTRH